MWSLILILAGVSMMPIQGASPTQPTQSPTATQKAPDVPVMDGEIGPCSVEFTVLDTKGKPVSTALINVKIAYGFAGIRKLEMGVYTNADGKGKFVGIPAKVHKPPLQFRASKNELAGIGSVDPATDCQAKHDILLDKKPSQ
ncbi:MAG TPA: hypothetical protein VEW69_06450 [Alphaproteobacteria bacterium]|nr:hypothetical protein [Alphaproteobacteria bacterium]